MPNDTQIAVAALDDLTAELNKVGATLSSVNAQRAAATTEAEQAELDAVVVYCEQRLKEVGQQITSIHARAAMLENAEAAAAITRAQSTI